MSILYCGTSENLIGSDICGSMLSAEIKDMKKRRASGSWKWEQYIVPLSRSASG